MTIMDDPVDCAALYRLLTWCSPAFPTGGFSYSHGLETAVAEGLATDAAGLREWVSGALEFGAGRVDGAWLAAAHAAAEARDWERLRAVADAAAAQRASGELALESAAQGEAFLRTARAAWPHPWLDRLDAARAPHSVAVGLTAAAHGVGLRAALLAWLHGFAANLVSAGVRLIPLGQTDGQRVLAALEPVVRRVLAAARAGGDAPGAATPAADWCAMAHETQWTRLFRS